MKNIPRIKLNRIILLVLCIFGKDLVKKIRNGIEELVYYKYITDEYCITEKGREELSSLINKERNWWMKLMSFILEIKHICSEDLSGK